MAVLARTRFGLNMLKTGVRLLRSRYKLVAGPVLDETISQAWLGVDEDDNRFLIKVWPFN